MIYVLSSFLIVVLAFVVFIILGKAIDKRIKDSDDKVTVPSGFRRY